MRINDLHPASALHFLRVMRFASVLLVLSACAHTIKEQKPRAWFGDFDVSPVSEPFPQGMAKPRPSVFAVGARIPIESSWSAVCKTPTSPGGNNGERVWEIHDCNAVPHHAVLVCDHPACRVESPDAVDPHATGIATLTAPGRYPMRVEFYFGEGEKKIVKLPVVEAAVPDDAAARCITDDVNITVEVSLLRNHEVLPGSPALSLSSGASCKRLGTAYDSHAAVFECPLQSPGLAQWVDRKIEAPNVTKTFNANCARRPRP